MTFIFLILPEHLEALINESKPDVIFCSSSSINIIADILNTTTHQPTLKISTMIKGGFTIYDNFITPSDDLFVEITKSISQYRPFALIYSSGTTGVPKGIYLSEDAIKFALISFK